MKRMLKMPSCSLGVSAQVGKIPAVVKEVTIASGNMPTKVSTVCIIGRLWNRCTCVDE